jgi:hypothetical protein
MADSLWLRVWAAALYGLAAIPNVSNAQEAAPQASNSSAKDWLQQREAEFLQYGLRRESQEPMALTMEPRSVLNWSNPERGTGQGPVFLWTDKERPQMIACAFEWGGSLKHEFHSLSTDPIQASRGGAAVHRFGPGVEWQPLSDAPAIARERSLRLTQMRRQAQRFGVSVGNKEWAQARLLPQPLFRSPASAAVDVALFVFVQGTDPECVLLVEATQEKGWRFALARMTKWGLKAELDGKPVWERLPVGRPETTDPQTPFIVLAQQP